jgi:hypothetical protein
VPPGSGKDIIIKALKYLTQELARQNSGIGHLKVLLERENGPIKVSLPTLEEPGWEDKIPFLDEGELHLIINGRAELGANDLRDSLARALDQPGVQVSWIEGDAFHPRPPVPIYRFS